MSPVRWHQAPGPVTKTMLLRDLAAARWLGGRNMGMEKTAAEAGNSASVGEGLGVLGEGSGTRKAREPKEGYRVSPLSEAHICKRPTIIFFLPFWDFFF